MTRATLTENRTTNPAPAGAAPTPGPASGLGQVVSFLLGGEEFALPIMSVEQIDGPLSIVPATPADVLIRGTARLRGQTIPVVDLGQRLGVAKARDAKDSRTLIITIAGQAVAVTVDRVSEVLCLKPNAISPAAPRRGVDPACIQGTIRIKGRSIPLLAPDRLLSPADLQRLPQFVVRSS